MNRTMMHRIPFGVRLATSLVLAVVLAFGGALLGSRLVAPGAAAPGSEGGPVAEPVTEPATEAIRVPASALPEAIDDEADVEALVEGLQDLPATVDVPVEPIATEDLVAELTDELVASDDPGTAASLGGGLLPPADPCAATPAECPAGVLATVLPLLDGSYPALRIVRAGLPVAGGWADACRRDGSVRYAIETTTPVSGELLLWAHADRTRTARVDVQTGAAQDAAWERDYRARGVATIVHCVILDFPGTGVHEVVISLASPDGGTASLHSQVDASGMLSMPRAWILTPSEDVITAIVPYRPGERVSYVLHDLSDGEQAICGVPRDASDAHIRQLVEPRRFQVTEQYLAGRNEMPGVTERMSVSWVAGEGRHVLVCMTVSDAAVNSRQFVAVVSTRDVPVPVVRVWGEANPSGDTMIVNASTGTGGPCGYDRVEPYSHATPGLADPRPEPPLCDYGADSGGGSAGVEDDIPAGREVPLSGGYLDRFTVAISPERDPTDVVRSTIDLAALRECGAASCPVPGPSYHVVRDPESGRMLVLEVTWAGGVGRSGVSTTTVSPVVGTVDSAAAFRPYPVLDRTVRAVGAVVVSPTGHAVAHITTGIRVDTTADYVIRLVPDSGESALCRFPGAEAPIEYSGTYVRPAGGAGPVVPIRFDGLCSGSTYRIEVVLTSGFTVAGEAPAVSVWGQNPRPPGVPAGASYGGALLDGTIGIPGGGFRMTPTMEVVGYDELAIDGTATSVAVTLTLNGAPFAGPGVVLCSVAPGETALVPVDVGALVPERGTTVRIAGTIQPLVGCPDPGGPRYVDPGLPPVTFAVDATFDELSGDGVTHIVWADPIDSPFGSFSRPAAVVRLRF